MVYWHQYIPEHCGWPSPLPPGRGGGIYGYFHVLELSQVVHTVYRQICAGQLGTLSAD